MNHVGLAEEVAALRDTISKLVPTINRIEATMNEVLIKRPSRSAQAKKLGVHPSTLWRREKRAARKLMVNGKL